MSFENQLLQLLDNHPPHFQKLIFESHQWNSSLSQGFRKHFQNPNSSVPNLEFLLHYKVFQEGHDANHQATNPGDK
jgi:hypothetical protein